MGNVGDANDTCDAHTKLHQSSAVNPWRGNEQSTKEEYAYQLALSPCRRNQFPQLGCRQAQDQDVGPNIKRREDNNRIVEIDALCFYPVIPQGLDRDAVKDDQHDLASAVRENEGTGAPQTQVKGGVETSFCKNSTV